MPVVPFVHTRTRLEAMPTGHAQASGPCLPGPGTSQAR